MKTRMYGYPRLGREGLAHSLLAWARCVVWCHQTGAQMIAPRWFKLRLGPYLRRERDKRNYFLCFRSAKHMTGVAREFRLFFSKKLFSELDLPNQDYKQSRDTVVIFRNAETLNEKKFFHHVAGHSALIKGQLKEITRSRYLPNLPQQPHIAVHVRRGDFKIATNENFDAFRTNTQLRIEWYKDVLTRLRAALGEDIPAIVYSDGEDAELTELLSLPAVRRSTGTAAVTDLLGISEATVLIASVSGFSQWGSFLGNVPCISFPNQSLFSYLPDLIDEVEIGQNVAFPKWFIEKIQAKVISASK